MRRDADREERNARLLAGVVLAAMLVMLSGIIHLLYHREYAETDTPNAVSYTHLTLPTILLV